MKSKVQIFKMEHELWSIEEKNEWNQYARERHERYLLDKKDPLVDYATTIKSDAPAQYIWELLQNAEDALATNVYIHLSRNSLIFQHDGKKEMSRLDVEKITKIGFSGRVNSNDFHIGQFGIGFKSVFNYSDCVDIHTADVDFSLKDYTDIENNISRPLDLISSDCNTFFKINFREFESEKTRAFDETNRMLKSLNERHIIFLKNISCINATIDDNQKSEIRVEKYPSDNFVNINKTIYKTENDIRYKHPEKTTWVTDFKTCKSYNFNGKDGTIRSSGFSYMGVAIAVDDISDKVKLKPIDGKLFTFFPLDQEKTGLKFHIHAPFSINVTRNQLHQSNELQQEINQNFVKDLSTLFCNLIEKIVNESERIDVFEVLPIKEDAIAEIYQIFAFDIKKLFKEKKLIRDFENKLFYAEEVISIEHLKIEFFANPNFYQIYDYAKNARNSQNRNILIQKSVKTYVTKNNSARINAFLNQVGVAQINNTKLNEVFQTIGLTYKSKDLNNKNIRNVVLDWLDHMDYYKIRKLYLVLFQSNVEKGALEYIPLFPTYNSGEEKFKDSREVYLAHSPSDPELNLLHREVFKPYETSFMNDDEKKRHNELKNFFKQIGLEVNNEWTKFRKLEDSEKPDNQHLEYIKKAVSLWESNSEKFEELYSQKIFLFGFSDSLKLFSPYFLIRNFSLGDYKLFDLLKSQNLQPVHPLWDNYERIPNFEKFAISMGVINQVFSKERSFRVSLILIEKLLRLKNIAVTKYLWELFKKLSYEDFRNVVKDGTKTQTLIEMLNNLEWVPDSEENYFIPAEIELEDINSILTIDKSVFFTLCNFGEAARKLEEDKKAKLAADNKLAKDAGFESYEYMTSLQKLGKQLGGLAGVQRELSKNSLDDSKTVDQIINQLPNLENRESAAKRKNVTSQVKNSREDYSEMQVLRRLELRRIYGDQKSGSVSCQLCGRGMPFKYDHIENGIIWDYFETVAFFKSIKKESKGNVLALCPVCSAKIKYFRKHPSLDDHFLGSKISELYGDLLLNPDIDNEKLKIRVTVLGDDFDIKFNKEHLTILYTVWNEWQGK